MAAVRSIREQLDLFKMLLAADTYERDSPLFARAIAWVRQFPGTYTDDDRDELRRLIKQAFEISEEDLQRELAQPLPLATAPKNGTDPRILERELWQLIPEGGFYFRYCMHTARHEAPLAYHLFSALMAVGATIHNRVWFPFGDMKLYPNLAIILLGPSGLKKTAASDVAVSMLQEMELTKIYSEQITPQALVEAMSTMPQGLIYAPEMSVFLGKQKYMEGIVPLITRLLDCPPVWSSERVTRTKIVLRDVAISTMWCTTIVWFVKNTPEDTFTGGFLPRHILVVQEDSARLEAFPGSNEPMSRTNLMGELARVHRFEGQIELHPKMRDSYIAWYREHKQRERQAEHELLSTSLRRKPTNLLRLTMCLHIAEHDDLQLCEKCFVRATKLFEWTEQFLPSLVRQMFKSESGASQDFILHLIRTSGGMIDHSTLVRRAQYRMNANEIRYVLVSLKEAKQIKELHDKIQHTYVLTGGTDGR